MKPITKITSLFFVLLFLTGSSAFAQSAVQSAFTKSYASEKSGKYSDAIKEVAAIYDEKSYEINLRLAYLNYEAGLFTESMSYYQRAMNLMPYSIEAKFGYVLPAAAAGNWDAVLNQYLEITKIDPQNTKANYRIGSIYYGRKDYSKAFEYLEKVVNLYPFDYDGLLLYAWCNLQLGKVNEAKVLFNKTLLLAPDDKSALEGLKSIK